MLYVYDINESEPIGLMLITPQLCVHDISMANKDISFGEM